MYQDYGWTYIQDLNEYSYFCKVAEDEEEANEIFSDNQSRIDMMDRIIRRKMLPIVAIFLCCVIPQAVRMADGMYTDCAVCLFDCPKYSRVCKIEKEV